MIITTLNKIIAASPEVLFQGTVNQQVTMMDTMSITSPTSSSFSVQLYHTIDGVRTKVLDVDADAGDQVIFDSPCAIKYRDKVEIETSVGIHVTYRLYRYEP